MTLMQSGGSPVGGFCIVVECHRGGSATNSIVLSFFFLSFVCSFVSIDQILVPIHQLTDKGTKGQRNKGKKGQREKGTKGQREKGTQRTLEQRKLLNLGTWKLGNLGTWELGNLGTL